MNKTLAIGFTTISVAAALLLPSGKVSAQGISYQFNDAFPSNPDPSGSIPWIVAYFQDVSPGTVNLSITAANLTSPQYVGALYFNLNTNLFATSLTFSLQSSNGISGVTINQDVDAYKADGDGKYDIRFNFATGGGPGSGRFEGGDSIAYTITGIAGLTAADFGYLSLPAGGHGPFYAAAHVQSLPGGASAWVYPTAITVVPVPEPATYALAVLGGLGALLLRRQK